MLLIKEFVDVILICQKKNNEKRQQLAKEHLSKCQKFCEEMKLNLTYLETIKDHISTAHQCKNWLQITQKKKSVKHGGLLVVAWDLFTSFGLGPIVKIEGKMKGVMYKEGIPTRQ